MSALADRLALHRGAGREGRPAQPYERLTTAIAWVAMVAAALGIVVDGVYGADEAAAQMLRGFDAVTLVVVAPALLLAIRADRRGAELGRLVVASLLAYLAYTYAYHLLGAGFTDLLLVHAALFTAAWVALGLTLRSVVTESLTTRSDRAAVRLPAALLALLAVSLGAMWTYASVDHVVTGTVPVGSSLVESETVVHLGIVLDLTLLVPLYAAAAVLLWKHRVVGFVLATLALLAGTLHQVSYVVALLFQSAADVPGSVPVDPFEPVIILVYVVATTVLLRRRAGSES